MPTTHDPRPNLVFILTDDQRFDALGCAGNPIIQTPHLDALAASGTRFTNAFATTPICAASRASLFTGLYERTHRMTFGTPPLADRFVDMSYPVLLREAGYRTGFSGKFGISVHPGAEDRMFDDFVPMTQPPYFQPGPDGRMRHLTDLEGDAALAFLDTVPAGTPFCLSLSFNAPHADDQDPLQYFWQAECDGLYEEDTIPVPATMTDDIFLAQPDFLRNSESRVRFNWRFDEPEMYQRMVKGYYRMITGIDRVVGRIRQDLDRRGLAENTVIVFMSDNGYFLGERGFADKWYMYEYSLRVPLIVCDPRIHNQPATVDAMALNVDIAATLLDFAGVGPAPLQQGRSLVPLIRGRDAGGFREDFLCEHLFEHPGIPKSEGVRTGRMTYFRWIGQDHDAEELYDHVADFDEIRNLVGDPGCREAKATLLRRMETLLEQCGRARDEALSADRRIPPD